MVKARRIVLLAALGLLLGAAPALGATTGATLVAREGRVILSGNAPFISVVLISGEERLAITGALTRELRKLQEVPLRVVGWRKDSVSPGLPPLLDVLGYAPVSDGYGKAPRLLVGTLARQGADWLLVDPGSARLYQLMGSLPPGLEDNDGAKVLLRGRAVKGKVTPLGFKVEGFQVISPPAKT